MIEGVVGTIAIVIEGIVGIIAIVVIIAFIVFYFVRRKKGQDLGERNQP